MGHINADDFTARPDGACRQETIESRAGSQIQDGLPGPQRSNGYRVAAAKAQICSFRREGSILGGIAQLFAVGGRAAFITTRRRFAACGCAISFAYPVTNS